MDLETVAPEEYGASLRGMGVNLLVRDVRRHAALLAQVFDMRAHRVSGDFAIMRYGASMFMLHADQTYSEHPLLGLLPETPPRGAGIELRLYDTDPDAACTRASAAGFDVLQPPTDKPHGLREAVLVCPDGYAWLPSRPL